MRKIITILALALTVALCASFAVSAADPVTISGLSNTTTDATVDYTPAGNDPEKIYSVDVTWNDVSFSYNAGTKQWNPSTHAYDDAANGEDAKWTESAGRVTVTNHSNDAVEATVSFETANNGSATVTITNDVIDLPSAEGKATTDAELSGTATLTAGGVPSANGKIGTLKVTIAAGN